METTQVSTLPLLLLQCIVGSVLCLYATRQQQQTYCRGQTRWAEIESCVVYCPCECSPGTFACCPALIQNSHTQKKRQKKDKSQSHLYIVLFLKICMYVRECGSSVRICPPMMNIKRKTVQSPQVWYGAQKKGDLSSPIVLCNKSHLVTVQIEARIVGEYK